MSKSLIIGMGQVGQALADVIKDAQTLDTKKASIKRPIDIMHIAFPYSKNFIKQVKEYQRKYRPLVTVIYSTVPIGTSQKLKAMHSPIEGIHPKLGDAIERFVRFIGSDSSHYPVADFWRDLGVEVQEVSSTKATEFMKLRSTAKYGMNLVWTDYESRVADELGMDFQLIKDFDEAYNQYYVGIDNDKTYQRYILEPPNGKIGGHCVVPNAHILDDQFPHAILKMIKRMQ